MESLNKKICEIPLTMQIDFSIILKSSRVMTEVNSWEIPLEKYSSGRRGAPAKGIGRETGARVQIPPSPLYFLKYLWKNLLTLLVNHDSIYKLSRTSDNELW